MNAFVDLNLQALMIPCILFALVSAPATYKMVSSVVGKMVKTCDSNGCPTMEGLVLHTLVFGLLLNFSQNALML